MAQFFDQITDEMKEFIEKQKMFFNASAPIEGGHVNVSPKGMDCFRIIGDNQVAYLDITGSGNETSAHLRQNGRITIMFCAFDGKPKIIRLFGTGRVVVPTDEEWMGLSAAFDLSKPGIRQIIMINVHKTQTSCGMGVPFYAYEGDRSDLLDYWDKGGEEFVKKYQAKKNVKSMDGLDAYPLEDA
ncbi:pyridoxamine 5'-phosphate oxidase family protein [Terasakiella sp. A23]|uniref:pyridoxamine 5'-phosphate oxidase family protein n=1 Tax=Terasakiella sp. FCG-A23 TaxID=3080561 RepID=UPI0029539E3A|nr:pyridoxamine 5'-phosphate oxidase family protein [Terasakiella sp. A23]MDV7341057.1 pyridoxamine 5'-phosphate oxidase family protein [Terasakiella sp. A23]